jgi:hypothetical protein
MAFEAALVALKAGQRVQRTGWNGKGLWLKLQRPDAHSKMTLPYIYLEYPEGSPAYPNGARVPWLASQTDLLSEDWETAPKPPLAFNHYIVGEGDFCTCCGTAYERWGEVACFVPARQARE